MVGRLRRLSGRVRGRVQSDAAFPLPDSDSYSNSSTDSFEVNKGSTGTDSDGDSDGDSYGQLLRKLLKFHLISTDISAKLVQ